MTKFLCDISRVMHSAHVSSSMAHSSYILYTYHLSSIGCPTRFRRLARVDAWWRGGNTFKKPSKLNVQIDARAHVDTRYATHNPLIDAQELQRVSVKIEYPV